MHLAVDEDDRGKGESVVREPTMADIANYLGISRQLVSIVLRDMPGASEETRGRVKQAAQDLGYSPHQGARLLRQYTRPPTGHRLRPRSRDRAGHRRVHLRRGRRRWSAGGPQCDDEDPYDRTGDRGAS